MSLTCADLRLRLSAALERFSDAVVHDLDMGLALPGLVVVFALGIAVYFILPREPWWPAPTGAALLAAGVTALRRRAGHAARLAACVTALLAGIAVGAVTTHRVAAPRLDHERTVIVEGRVIDVDATARGGLRLGLDVVRMEGRGLTAASTPTRITATLTNRAWRPEVGDAVRFKARLKPPEGPVLPGGYDFARRAFFEGRGAGGYVLGLAEPIDLGPPGPVDRLFAPVGALRHAIAERVRASLPGPTGTIGAALMVGEQRAIPDSVGDPLRASGLTHIVSISGLHMSLVAGGVIVAIRGLLALFPVLALGFPIKKWAAAVALLATTIYLLLSGNQVAALRSHLMLSVALLAVLVDRPAITMHTVAVSAALILAFDPEQVLEPSFLMSYLAVIALVASYDLWRTIQARRPPPVRDQGLVAHLTVSGLRHVEGLAFSSLVAGLATAPVIAGVFFRGAPYSILANMLVLPVTGMVIMPAAVVAALAMPFGLDPVPLTVMGWGIDWMIAVGRWTAALPAGAGLIGVSHPAMMPTGIAAVLWLSAWKSRVRLLGLIPAATCVVLLALGPRPDVLIGRHGAPIAVRGADGRLDLLTGRQERFDTAIWLAANDDPRTPDDPSLAAGWRCDPLGCTHDLDRPALRRSADPGEARHAEAAADGASAPPPPFVAVIRHPLAFAEDCRRAALVITALEAPPACRALTQVIDRRDLARHGATALTIVGLLEPPPKPSSRQKVPITPQDPTIDASDLARSAAPNRVAASGASPPGQDGASGADPLPRTGAAGADPQSRDGSPRSRATAASSEPAASTNTVASVDAAPSAAPTARAGSTDPAGVSPAFAPDRNSMADDVDPAVDGIDRSSGRTAPGPDDENSADETPVAATGGEPPRPSRLLWRTAHALPWPPRPWTPVDPAYAEADGADEVQ